MSLAFAPSRKLYDSDDADSYESETNLMMDLDQEPIPIDSAAEDFLNAAFDDIHASTNTTNNSNTSANSNHGYKGNKKIKNGKSNGRHPAEAQMQQSAIATPTTSTATTTTASSSSSFLSTASPLSSVRLKDGINESNQQKFAVPYAATTSPSITPKALQAAAASPAQSRGTHRSSLKDYVRPSLLNLPPMPRWTEADLQACQKLSSTVVEAESGEASSQANNTSGLPCSDDDLRPVSPLSDLLDSDLDEEKYADKRSTEDVFVDIEGGESCFRDDSKSDDDFHLTEVASGASDGTLSNASLDVITSMQQQQDGAAAKRDKKLIPSSPIALSLKTSMARGIMGSATTPTPGSPYRTVPNSPSVTRNPFDLAEQNRLQTDSEQRAIAALARQLSSHVEILAESLESEAHRLQSSNGDTGLPHYEEKLHGLDADSLLHSKHVANNSLSSTDMNITPPQPRRKSALPGSSSSTSLTPSSTSSKLSLRKAASTANALSKSPKAKSHVKRLIGSNSKGASSSSSSSSSTLADSSAFKFANKEYDGIDLNEDDIIIDITGLGGASSSSSMIEDADMGAANHHALLSSPDPHKFPLMTTAEEDELIDSLTNPASPILGPLSTPLTHALLPLITSSVPNSSIAASSSAPTSPTHFHEHYPLHHHHHHLHHHDAADLYSDHASTSDFGNEAALAAVAAGHGAMDDLDLHAVSSAAAEGDFVHFFNTNHFLGDIGSIGDEFSASSFKAFGESHHYIAETSASAPATPTGKSKNAKARKNARNGKLPAAARGSISTQQSATAASKLQMNRPTLDIEGVVAAKLRRSAKTDAASLSQSPMSVSTRIKSEASLLSSDHSTTPSTPGQPAGKYGKGNISGSMTPTSAMAASISAMSLMSPAAPSSPVIGANSKFSAQYGSLSAPNTPKASSYKLKVLAHGGSLANLSNGNGQLVDGSLLFLHPKSSSAMTAANASTVSSAPKRAIHDDADDENEEIDVVGDDDDDDGNNNVGEDYDDDDDAVAGRMGLTVKPPPMYNKPTKLQSVPSAVGSSSSKFVNQGVAANASMQVALPSASEKPIVAVPSSPVPPLTPGPPSSPSALKRKAEYSDSATSSSPMKRSASASGSVGLLNKGNGSFSIPSSPSKVAPSQNAPVQLVPSSITSNIDNIGSGNISSSSSSSSNNSSNNNSNSNSNNPSGVNSTIGSPHSSYSTSLIGGHSSVDNGLRRKFHNVLERKRRDDLNRSFLNLQRKIPDLLESSTAPKVQILRKAADFIRSLREREQELERIKELAKQERDELERRLQTLRLNQSKHNPPSNAHHNSRATRGSRH